MASQIASKRVISGNGGLLSTGGGQVDKHKVKTANVPAKEDEDKASCVKMRRGRRERKGKKEKKVMVDD